MNLRRTLPLLAGATLAALCAANPAQAQITAEANVAKADGDWGGEIGVGYPILRDGGFSVTPSVGAFFHDRDHPGFEEQGGDCYRRSNGDLVDGDRCDSSGVKAYARMEAMYRLPVVSLGVGARFMGDSLRAYGTAAMPVMPMLEAKLNLGDDYLAAGLLARF